MTMRPGAWSLPMFVAGASSKRGAMRKVSWPIISPRLWHWQEREKLLLMAQLSYAFLLTLLEPFYDPLRVWLLRRFCHRTGRHARAAKAPLYRLRNALSRLWQDYPPNFALLGHRRHAPEMRIAA